MLLHLDLFQEVLNYLPIREILNFKKINKTIHNFINSEIIIENFVDVKKHTYFTNLSHETSLLKIFENNKFEKIHINTFCFTDEFVKYLNKKTLKKFMCYNCRLTNNNITNYLENIEILNIHNNNSKINVLDDDSLKKMPKLKKLKVSCVNNITDHGFIHIPNIEHLSIDSKILTDEALKYIPKIRYLEIFLNNKITKIGLEYMKNYKNLKYLYLPQNKNILVRDIIDNFNKLENFRIHGISLR